MIDFPLNVPLRHLALVMIALLFELLHGGSTFAGTTPPSLESRKIGTGVVATSEAVATRVGAEILQKGGNAIDAAAAVAFALNVVEPQSSGIGGGGFMMVHLAKSRQTFVVDSRETAPAKADPRMFLDSTGSPFPYSLRSTSGIAVGVPGMVRGIALALAKWGTFPFPEILKPAIILASGGIRVSSRLAADIEVGLDGGRLSHEPGHPSYEEARTVFAPKQTPPQPGDLLVQKDLANTFRLLAEHGPDAFYTGVIAEAIVATQRTTRTLPQQPDQPRLKGRMSLQDLIQYRPIIRQPIEGTYRGYRILSSPLPSSGGLTVLQILALLERFPLGRVDKGYGFGSPRTLHVMCEAMRLAFADRAVWMGDSDSLSLPTQGLLNPQYILARSALIEPDTRQATITAGNPLPFDPAFAAHPLDTPPPSLPQQEGQHTTHFTIRDRFGNIVTYTNTIEDVWGTGLMVPGFGFLLNNELTDFNPTPTRNLDPHHFNPGANDVAPNKRPRSSMAPTLVFRADRPVAAYGSPGGPTIIHSVVNVTVNLIDHHMTLEESITAPRLSLTDPNGPLTVEKPVAPSVVEKLKNLGHTINLVPSHTIGAVQAVAIDPTTGQPVGAADPRRNGSVISLTKDMKDAVSFETRGKPTNAFFLSPVSQPFHVEQAFHR